MQKGRCIVLPIVILMGVMPVSAQKVYWLNRLVDSVLTIRYHRADFDSTYVTRPQTKWTLTGRANMSGARIGTEGQEDGHSFSTKPVLQ